MSGRLLGTNLAWIAAGCLLGAAPALKAQDASTGVSVPQPVLTDSSESAPATAPAKPSAATPLKANTADGAVVYGPYVPYHAPGTAAAPPADTSAAAPFDPDANIVTEESMHRRRLLTASGTATEDVDAHIVTRVPTHPGEISEGTLVRARLGETISTLKTLPGTRFTAQVAEPVMQNGRVYIPEGSVIEGRVTSLHGGKRIGGGASIHLEPQWVMLPDGTSYTLNARVIDTSSWQNTKVDEEGTIVRREDNMKGTVAAGGLTVGGAMAAGAIVGGLPGALIGAGVGAGATAVVWLRQDRQAELPKDLGIVFSLTAPVTVTPSQAGLPPTAVTGHAPGE